MYHGGSRTSRWKKVLDVKTSWCLSNKGVTQSKASAIGRYWVKETRCPVRHGWSVVDDSWCGYWATSNKCVSKTKTSSESRQRSGEGRRPVGYGRCMVDDCRTRCPEGRSRKPQWTETKRRTKLSESWSRLNERGSWPELGQGWCCLDKGGGWSKLGHCWSRLNEGGCRSEPGHCGSGMYHGGSRTSRWKKVLDVKTSWCLSNKGVSQSKASAIGRYWVKETRCPVRHGWSVVDDSWCG
ncbi:hypothetical protein IscW_ISCW001139 [Ixodes scapularis]|uniref:Uncharacterized protein n=1 Tax=Ixodes scapularis TaxID=6945 RepID=B7P4L4_IXOSC|nr:hypothetical protein IscW_ISCW001139 [Ixodes scapularis]|eukprot:XP_002406214.1 hypothetical protein IscW_ISCW001139 [Ixodes scapularis]